jgi:hypothetical protein
MRLPENAGELPGWNAVAVAPDTSITRTRSASIADLMAFADTNMRLLGVNRNRLLVPEPRPGFQY